jgi:Flp pilus assembly protein TadG
MHAALETAEARPTLQAQRFASCRQGGVIAIMLAVLLPVIIGFMAFALELGQMYNRIAEMQAVADGIAVSAAKKLNGTKEGISEALAAAHDAVESGDATATKPHYQYGKTMVVSDEAIRFGNAPDGGAGWLSADAAKVSPAGIAYVKVDTNALRAEYGTVDLVFMRVLSSLQSVKVSHTSVAGRQRLNVTPLAICAMSKDPGHPFAERVNPAESSELTEHGFRRGVSYNLLKLSPNTATAVNYVLDPISLPPTAGNFSTTNVGPYVCTGTVELPRVIGETLNLTSSYPVSDLVNQLNSRFNLFTGAGKCNAVAAPPDSNTKSFSPATVNWMNVPRDNVADQATTANRMETVADLYPLTDTDPTHYGPLWAFARPVPWSAYSPGQAEPANGYTTFQAVNAIWKSFYNAADTDPKSYPTDPKTGLQSPPYFTQVIEPATNYPGVPYRRVLNVPLLDCPAPGSPGKVLAIGRFFMTVPADASGIYAEFAGVTLKEVANGPVELYR